LPSDCNATKLSLSRLGPNAGTLLEALSDTINFYVEEQS